MQYEPKNPLFARTKIRFTHLVSAIKMSRRTATKMLRAQRLPKAVINWMAAAELVAEREGGHPWDKLEEMRKSQ
ncbi:hypothetical protein [Meiothermus sp. Pnk-1]|uniref:hypothetical protein n=1 Tax=Meiothermus sp. Pnk-1 TaxID=873128 RepID=UPI000D7C681E|nr:hypothetical protein [Meiothermus sp. Pnk-1]PZA08264.1 hypothetical protein DNA98_03760 [Meiothermus sp. Pnk-1]